MNANSHIDIDASHLPHKSEMTEIRIKNLCHFVTLYHLILRDCVNHVNPELHAAVGVVWTGLGHAADAVVAVTQQLDPQTVMFIGEFV